MTRHYLRKYDIVEIEGCVCAFAGRHSMSTKTYYEPLYYSITMDQKYKSKKQNVLPKYDPIFRRYFWSIASGVPKLLITNNSIKPSRSKIKKLIKELGYEAG